MDVFLGSSKTLDDLRLAFTALCDTLADTVADDCDAALQARVWETEGYEIERDRSKQQAYDEVIRTCERAFFLVDGTLGTYTYHEYLVATQACALQGLPRVDVWVRHLERADEQDENTRLMLAHATNKPHVELHELVSENDLLLDMLALFVQDFPGLRLTIRRDAVWAGHKRLVSLKSVATERRTSFEALLASRTGAAAGAQDAIAPGSTQAASSSAHKERGHA